MGLISTGESNVLIFCVPTTTPFISTLMLTVLSLPHGVALLHRLVPPICPFSHEYPLLPPSTFFGPFRNVRFEEEADIEDEVYGSSMLVPSPIAAAGIMNFTPSPTSSVAGTYSESSITSYDPGSSHGAASAATYSQATTSQLVRNPMCNEELAKIVSNIITSSR